MCVCVTGYVFSFLVFVSCVSAKFAIGMFAAAVLSVCLCAVCVSVCKCLVCIHCIFEWFGVCMF